jgi:DNA integrity scanning protein DisA with diadenylate cyclase activity
MHSEKFKKIEETILQVGLRIAKRNEGALFVIGSVDHKPLVDQTVPPFDITKNPKLLESLALIDGAVIIDENGLMGAYGVLIKTRKVFKNFGTRHSAAISASKNGNVVFLVSQEDKKIRIFKDEKLAMQIDALQKNVENNVSSAVNILESIGAGTLGTIGTTVLAPTLGLSLLPGILVFGSAYYLTKYLSEKFKK